MVIVLHLVARAAEAAPFALVPRMHVEGADAASLRSALAAPAGFELLASPRRWGAESTTGPRGTEIAAHVAALAWVMAGTRVQATGSTLGTSFYREQRFALTASAPDGASGLAAGAEVRRLAIEGMESLAGLGLTLHASTANGPLELAGALGPTALTGTRTLFPRAWQLAAWLGNRGDGVGARLAASGGASPSLLVDAGWMHETFGLRATIDLDRGAITLTGSASGAVTALLSMWSHAEAGSRLSVGVLDRGGR